MITVRSIDAATFEVTVDASTVTTHMVTVSADYYLELTNGAYAPEDLIRKSFELLLEREPNTSILRRFDLKVIGTYFPEYEVTIQKM